MHNNNLFTNKQFGFLPERSTVLQLIKILVKWTEEWDKGNDVDVIYCDFAKAFETVPHKRLLKKLYLCYERRYWYGLKSQLPGPQTPPPEYRLGGNRSRQRGGSKH